MNVVVELGPRLRSLVDDESADKALEAALGQLLGDLVEDLGLGESVELALRPGTPPATAGGGYEVLVDGRRCRQPVFVPDGDDLTARGLARSIVTTVYENRSILVTGSVVDRLRTRWAYDGPGAGGPERHELQAALEELVRRHCRVDDLSLLWSASARNPGRPATSEQLVEAALSGRERVGLVVHLPPDRDPAAGPAAGRGGLQEQIDDLGQTVGSQLGLVLPTVTVARDVVLEDDEFRVRVNDLRTPPVQVPLDGTVLVAYPPEVLDLYGVPAVRASTPLPGTEVSAVPDTPAVRQTLDRLELTTWPPAGHLAFHVFTIAKQQAGAFLTVELVRFYLGQLRTVFPTLADRAEAALGIDGLTWALRALLDDGVPIRDLRSILEALLALGGPTAAPATPSIALLASVLPAYPTVEPARAGRTGDGKASWIRPSLHRFVADHQPDGERQLRAFLLDPTVEIRLGKAGERPLDDQEHLALVAAIARAVGAPYWLTPAPTLVTSLALRPVLRRLVGLELPWLRVVGWEELPPGQAVEPAALIGWHPEPKPSPLRG